MEVIGECPFRARAKHRKASPPGESATSDEAQYPPEVVNEHGCTGDGMDTESGVLTHGDLPGSAMSGSP